eukprot:GDKJ01026271.1.p1 GENE.GDKJ01026271.1~~GDKJ01026271.1.p1  ORF type:complete len:683 (+),score=124.88 GDKJ01026271.1:53-2101(+)
MNSSLPSVVKHRISPGENQMRSESPARVNAKSPLNPTPVGSITPKTGTNLVSASPKMSIANRTITKTPAPHAALPPKPKAAPKKTNIVSSEKTLDSDALKNKPINRVPTAKEIREKAKADEEARKAEAAAMDEEIERLTRENCELETNLHSLQLESEDLISKLNGLGTKTQEFAEKKNELESEFEVKKKSWENNLTEYEREVSELEVILKNEQEKLEKGRAEIDKLRTDINEIRDLVESSSEENQQLEEELRDLTQVLELKSAKEIKRLERLDRLMKQLTSVRDFLDGKVPGVNIVQEKADAEKSIQLESFVIWDEKRKRLHTLAQDLRGSMRVLCRIRPPASSESSEDLLDTVLSKDCSQLVVRAPAAKDVTGMTEHVSTYPFTFDRVFAGPKVTQGVVFEEISQVVESALDGDQVAILAYGQTGSGKTYTMEGATAMIGNNAAMGSSQDPHRGIIPRSVEKIFAKFKEMTVLGWSFDVRLSAVEVYNEKVTDLLAKEPNGLPLPKGEEGGMSFEVKSEQDVYSYLAKASKSRTVAATNANQHSSRSHYLCYFKIVAKRAGQEDRCGSLCFVDLAGSERVSQTGATGERMREGTCINQSLTTLRNVFSQLALKSKSKDSNIHISYRQSKLTMLLKNFLHEKGKTLMFVNVSPLQKHMSETLSSFKFAESVSNVKQAAFEVS